MKDEKEKLGWQCPMCKKIHSPDTKTCDCNLPECEKIKTDLTTEKLLME